MSEQKSWVIDANIILRHILYDIPEQAEKVVKILEETKKGSLKLLIPEPVVSDVFYVLTYLKVPKPEITSVVRDWLRLPGISLLGIADSVIQTAMDLFVDKNIKWSDALIAAKMIEWGYKYICTFDAHFTRIPEIEKVTP